MVMMLTASLQRFLTAAAAGTVATRAGVVGVNFAAMVALAAYLGLHGFGELAFVWGIALVLSTVVSLGGPLLILRQTTDGCGMRPQAIMLTSVIYPLVLAGLLIMPLQALWPALPWLAILAAAFSINLISCLSSVLRGAGWIKLSMVLRDAGPQVALVAGVLIAPGSMAGTMVFASLAMGVAAAMVWCLVPRPKTQARNPGDRLSLWITMMLGIAIAQADLIIGGLFLPPELLGLYAVLRRFANLVAMPVSVATWVSAGAVSTAHGKGDLVALQRASDAGNRVALISGLPLFLLGVAGLFFVPFFALPVSVSEVQIVLFVLLGGAALQVAFASGMTVATLCGLARWAALSRAISLSIYGGLAMTMGSGLDLVANALCYALAMSIGSAILWLALQRRLGVDTAVTALWRGRVALWRLS